MIRTLRPGGLLILQGFTPAQLGRSSGGPPDIAMLYETAMQTADFSGLVPVHCVEHIISLDDGQMHQEDAAVIDLVMHKQKDTAPRVKYATLQKRKKRTTERRRGK